MYPSDLIPPRKGHSEKNYIIRVTASTVRTPRETIEFLVKIIQLPPNKNEKENEKFPKHSFMVANEGFEIKILLNKNKKNNFH